MRVLSRITIFIATISLSTLLFTPNIFAQTNTEAPSAWHFIVAPYGWLFGMKGSMTVKGNQSTMDITPSDIAKKIGDVDYIFELHAEARKGRWSLMVDPTFLKLTTDVRVGPITASITPKITLIDFGAYYRFICQSYGNGMKSIAVAGFVGGRHMTIGMALRLPRLPKISGEKTWTAPVIGARIMADLSQRWALILRGDIGGFGADSVRSTWSATALAAYAFNQHVSGVIGIRALDADYSTGAGAGLFAMDLTFYGPEAGIIFSW